MLPALGGSQFTTQLEAWAAEATADETLARRRRERWLRTQADEEATFAGVLVDLAERARPVVISTRTGRQHRGRLRLVGADFCLLETDQRAAVFVSYRALASVRQPPGDAPVGGDRTISLEIGLFETMHFLVAERPRVLVVTGTETTAGELQRVGADVVTIRLDGAAGSAYLPGGVVDEVIVDDGAAAGI